MIFKYGDNQNITLATEKEVNTLIYRMLSYIIICKSYKLLKKVQFFSPPCTSFDKFSITKKIHTLSNYTNIPP